MKRIRFLHWNTEEAEERARRIEAVGYKVDCRQINPAGLRELRQDPPDAVVIDLSRLPSQGRDMGMNLRKYKSTRHVPLIFVDGDPVKIEGVKIILPDATYSTWDKIQDSLESAIANQPADPVTPKSVFDVYKGTPLPKKLGIKPNIVVAMVGAPEGFENTLGDLPEGVTLRRQARGRPDVTLWFTKSQAEVRDRIERMRDFIGAGTLWIIWPKKASKKKTDLSQVVVRKIGLNSGLVDFKICAVDATWSGLCFTRRKK